MQTYKLHTEPCDKLQERITPTTADFWQLRAIPTEVEIPRQHGPLVANWEEITPKLLFTFTEAMQTKWQEATMIEGLERKILLLEERLTKLERFSPVCVPIESFAPEPYEILKSFHVVVQTLDDENVATFFDANLSASGTTEAEAIRNVKDVILGVFDCLLTHDEANLGPEPLRQLHILKTFLRKKS